MPRPSRHSARAQGSAEALHRLGSPELLPASNDSGVVDVRPPFVDRSSASNIARLAEFTKVGGDQFSIFDILNKLDIDFSSDVDNIGDINSSEMKVKLIELASSLRASADRIERCALSAGANESLDVLTPAVGSLASEIRRHVFGVFRLAANTIGRAEPSAIVEDTRSIINRLISRSHIPMYSPASGGKLNEDPESWIKTTVIPHLDSDMASVQEGGQIPAFNLTVYKDDGSNPRLKRFYDSLAYWRRNRLRSDQSAATLVAARAYGRKKLA